MEREPEREPECGPSHVPWPQPSLASHLWEVCPNGPADHTCNASGHWAFLWECPHWSWHSACCCSVTAAGLLRPYPCTRLQLPSPCRPLLLPSPLRPLGTRARAYPRGDYMSRGSDFGLAGLPLQAEFRGPPNRAFRDGRPRISCICVLGAPPRLHRYKARMVDHPGRLVSERVVNR